MNQDISSHTFHINLEQLGSLNVSHICFKGGSLVNSEYAAKITKPAGYNAWRTLRKETFLAGRLAVRHAQKQLGVHTENILKAENGSPIWPYNYTGSISHTNSQAIAVLLPLSKSILKGVGIDIEERIHASKLEIANMIGTEKEFQILIDQNIAPDLPTLLLFSLKESVYKALFPIVGSFFDFLDAELVAIKDDVFIINIKRTLHKEIQTGFQIKGSFVEQGNHLITWAYW